MAKMNFTALSFYKTMLLFSRLVSLLKDANPVKIINFEVPRWVPNGTSHVILDCRYRYTENDLRLVVKWFFNDDSEPVYQWIPELEKRHVAEFLFGRLNLSFSVDSSDRYSRYRALYILNPSLEMSGKYTCHVASLAGQDSRHQEMLVYVPATTFNFTLTKCSETEVSFLCDARGLYPRPHISVSLLPLDYEDKKTYKRTTSQVIKTDATYSTSLTGTLFVSEFPDRRPPVLECRVEIPGTNYKISKQISYFPGNPSFSHSVISLFLLAFLISCIHVTDV
ncbi:uncharacterized protein LOC143233292 isoform X2 [Tachypleus tridentatus]|uniref:uncharacterized protein LOC143233292 isoform X2 n=1 Tax=Tachypleus tridentatus TaxID=6853 RepID=UPI003FD11E28